MFVQTVFYQASFFIERKHEFFNSLLGMSVLSLLFLTCVGVALGAIGALLLHGWKISLRDD